MSGLDVGVTLLLEFGDLRYSARHDVGFRNTVEISLVVDIRAYQRIVADAESNLLSPETVNRVLHVCILVRKPEQTHAVTVHHDYDLDPTLTDRIDVISYIDQHPLQQLRIAGVDVVYHFLAGIFSCLSHI